MTDILRAVVLKYNCINKIPCSLIFAFEGKYPHLYFLQAKPWEECLKIPASRHSSALSGTFTKISENISVVLNPNYKLITSHINRDHLSLHRSLAASGLRHGSCLITKHSTLQ